LVIAFVCFALTESSHTFGRTRGIARRRLRLPGRRLTEGKYVGFGYAFRCNVEFDARVRRKNITAGKRYGKVLQNKGVIILTQNTIGVLRFGRQQRFS
jgi:hypothetical protein